MTSTISLLTDPFLQLPTANTVEVIWFTEFAGEQHFVQYGENLEQVAIAKTAILSKVQEDKQSKWQESVLENTRRLIWRHQAQVKDISYSQPIPYQVTSIYQGQPIQSRIFTLSSLPPKNTPLNILLTSDHQLMPMVTANLEKVVQTIPKIDAVFLAGDLVNVADRASQWFDDSRGGAFFPALQGKAEYTLNKQGKPTLYRGGEIIQYAPLYTAVGNHEVMGRSIEPTLPLNSQFEAAIPRQVAKQIYHLDEQSTTLKDHSFNIDTYQEIFSLVEGNPYYAVTFGDIRLIVLYVTNIWRPQYNELTVKGRYQELSSDLNSPEKWGYGQHIFEPIAQGSPQYRWLESELASSAFSEARYKMVMFHHPPHTLGGNIVPPYTDPIQQLSYDAQKQLTTVHYDYPPEKDYIIRDLIPLLEKAGVQLVFFGHSHLWNRFVSPTGLHFLESSNVGNSYGAAWQKENPRQIPPLGRQYVSMGDPNGLEPVIPTLSPLLDTEGQPLPYIASNDITVFTILNTETATVSSYYFDTREADSLVIKFDEFSLK